MASDSPMPASEPAVASNPAQNAPPMSRTDDGDHRQEETDRDAGEAGQDEEDRFRDDIDRAATRGDDGAQACIPEHNQDGDCRSDPNERPPCFVVSLASIADE